MKINFDVGNIINRMIGYHFTKKESAAGRLKIQIAMVLFKLTHKKNFYSTTIHCCSTDSEIGLVSYFTVKRNNFVLEYTSNN